LGYGAKTDIFAGDPVFNRSILLSYRDILKASKEQAGKISLSFITPTQIKENDRFTATPSFRGLIFRLLSRANVLAGTTDQEPCIAARRLYAFSSHAGL
jgi:hypothetical protein